MTNKSTNTGEKKLLIIDGPSNTGKTTLCGNLEGKSDYTIIEEAPTFIKNRPQIFRGQDLPPIPQTLEEEQAVQKLLFEIELERLREAERILKDGEKVVLDRSFLSTVSIAYSFEEGLSYRGAFDHSLTLLDAYVEQINNLRVNMNIFFYFLVADYNKIRDRNNTRGKKLSDQWLEQRLIDKQHDFFYGQQDKFDAKVIDTTHKTGDEIVGIITTNIGGRK